MTIGFADRLVAAIREKKTPAVVAIDPVFERLPPAVTAGRATADPSAELAAILDFCRELIRVVAPLVPAVKVNSAYFEPYRGPGIDAYYDVVRVARRSGLLVIGDVKRGDVGHSAAQYARAHLTCTPAAGGDDEAVPDAVTISGYLGADGARPFIEAARTGGRGVFVLVRTSNPSAAAIQDVVTSDGRKVHEIVASQVAAWAAESDTLGDSGYASIGAVVATRDPADAARLRRIMPRSIFLVPGYGAQGGTAQDVRAYFNDDGLGAIVTAGRSVIYAHQQSNAVPWTAAVERACRDLIAALSAT